MSRQQRSHSFRTSPPPHSQSPIAERSEQRRQTESSVLLGDHVFNKILKNVHNIRKNTQPLEKQTEPFDAFEAPLREPHASPTPSSKSLSSHDISLSAETSPLSRSRTQLQNSTTLHPPSQTSIGTFPVHIQEYAVIEDMLFVLMGIDGTHVKCLYPKASEADDEDDDIMQDIHSELSPYSADYWDNVRYSVDPTLDPSLKHLVEKLLPLATYYESLDVFVEQFSRFEYGTINHALCSAMRVFLKEYLGFIAQLEHQFQTSAAFTLQRFWFYAQDTLQHMKILHNLAMNIRHVQTADRDSEDDIEAVLEDLKAREEKRGELRISERQRGGAILNILAEGLVGLSGDPKCKEIYSFLLSRASVPYFEILHAWIYRGEIKDSYGEFMVLEKKSVRKENLKKDFNDAYWEMRYTVREGLVPSFLEPLKSQILLAGKYLNVVRECGVNIANPDDMLVTMSNTAEPAPLATHVEQRNKENQAPEALRRDGSMSLHPSASARNSVWAAVDGGKFIRNLEIAYKYANHTLLNLLLKEQQLIGRLRSLKHYFFLDQSDFLTSFLDLAKEELKRPAQETSLIRLQSLMDLVLRNPSSVAAYDPYKEDVKVAMSPLKLVDQLLRIINVAGHDVSTPNPLRTSGSTGSIVGQGAARETLSGYDALTLDYAVAFPLSLVISRKALTKYQLLFRHLLNLKHVEAVLCASWMDQKGTRWRQHSGNADIERWKFRIFSLRNRMLALVQQFAYYVTNEVLEPNWRRLENNLGKVSTVDQVLQYHSDFLDTCLKECMLTNAKLLRIYNKLMSCCMKFASQTEQFTQLLNTMEDPRNTGLFGIPKAGTDSLSTHLEKSIQTLSKLEETYQYHMKLLVDALNYYSATDTVQFLCLVVRLDYNLYYNKANTEKPAA